jgi:dihydroorotate dehydrogenase electron transfer subunit
MNTAEGNAPAGKFQEDAVLLEQRRVARDTYRLRVESPLIARNARPGQFAMVRVAPTWEPLLRRPLSFHRLLPADNVVEFLYRVVGRGTVLLAQQRAGSPLNLLGPLGNGFSMPVSAPGTLALVAGGIGIAPLVAWIDALIQSGWPPAALHLFYGARSAAELLDPGELAAYGVTTHWATDDGSYGVKGLVTEVLAQAIDSAALQPAGIYACGALAMQVHVARLAVRHAIAAELSLESLMACGFGACLGCAIPALNPADPEGEHYWHVCQEGPIFRAESIQWRKIQQQRVQPSTLALS